MHDDCMRPALTWLQFSKTWAMLTLKTTLGYIGELDASKRRAPAVYSYDLRMLNGAPGEQLPLDE